MRRFTSQLPICEALVETVSRSASMEFHRITNRKPGGEPTHSFSSLSYASFCGVINCQIIALQTGSASTHPIPGYNN